MNRQQRAKLLTLTVAAVLVFGGLTSVYVEHVLRAWLDERVTEELHRQAQMASGLASWAVTASTATPRSAQDGQAAVRAAPLSPEERRSLADALVRQLSVAGECWASLKEPNGAVIAEAVPEEHRRAVADPRALWLSTSQELELGGGATVLRLAVPRDTNARSLQGVYWAFLGTAGLLCLGLLVLSGLQSRLASRALRSIVQSARAITAGHGLRRLAVTSDDDLGHLAGSFNELVDELDRTLHSLTGERDRLETILEGMSEGLVALDSSGRITHVNRAAIDLFGLPSHAERRLLMEATRAPALDELLQRVRSEGSAATEFELDVPRRRRVLARAARVRSTGDAVLVMLDITEIRHLEQVRRDFVANVSHELRTPLSVITANAETLRDGAFSDAKRGPLFVDAIVRNAQRLSRLVADLLDLSRIESGTYNLEPQPVVAFTVVSKTLDAVTPLAETKRIELSVDVPEDERVLADPAALEQVLINLLDNAVKYTPSGGHVQVRMRRGERPSSEPARPSKQSVEIDVLDDGAGIEPKHRTRIFERFYRVDPGRSREMGGTGLGLAIVKHLVVAMSGEISVHSNPAGGSIFRVRLPAVDAAGGAP